MTEAKVLNDLIKWLGQDHWSHDDGKLVVENHEPDEGSVNPMHHGGSASIRTVRAYAADRGIDLEKSRFATAS